MAIAVSSLVRILLIAAGAIIVFAVLSSVLFSFRTEGFACQLSVTLAHFELGSNKLSCRIADVEMPKRITNRELGAERFVAEQMLECARIYQTDRTEPLKDQDWLAPDSVLPSILTSRLPDGRLSDGNLRWYERLPDPFNRLEDPDRGWQYCSVCAVVTFPEDALIDGGFQEYLASDGFGSEPFAEAIYMTTERFDIYLPRNSESFLPYEDEKNDLPATAVIFYTEGRIAGEDRLGIVAMNAVEFQNMVVSESMSENFCGGGYLG